MTAALGNRVRRGVAALACGAWLALASLPVDAVAADADALAALQAAVSAERRRPAAPRLPGDALLATPAIQSPRISPDSRHVAWLHEREGVRSLWLRSVDGGPPRRLLARARGERLEWSQDGRWIFLVHPQELASVRVDGRDALRMPLGGVERRSVMQVDPSQPAALLVRERVRLGTAKRWRLVRVDVRGRRTVLREDRQWVHDVAIDRHGRIAALTRAEGASNALYRVDASGRLRLLRRLPALERAMLLGMTASGDLLLHGDTGGDLQRLQRLDRANRLHTLHVDPRGEADLDAVALDPATGEPRVVHYRSTQPASHGIGAAAPHVARLRDRLPGRDLAIRVGAGASPRWLVAERDSGLRDPRWHLYDPARGALQPLRLDTGPARHRVPESALARKIPLSYRASDGVRVHGFLLLPPGADPARLPLVAHVHGGPISHFRPDYDALAQLLVNRGYAVFQSNFRGSTGHGRAYLLSPRGDYGNGRVQRDIVDGVRYLLGRGIGDPARVGIVGHSFGGYSALLGVTFAPELFKVAVAGAPPTDFGWSMRWLVESGDQGARPDGSLVAMLRALSMDPGDPRVVERFRSQSPLAHARHLRRPVLLLAGNADRVVAIREVVHYAATLQALGKPVGLYVEPGGDHAFSGPLARDAYAHLMLAMLHAHLGGQAPEPPAARLRDHLRQNLRRPGDALASYVAPRR